MRILFFSSYYYPYISGVTTYPRILFSHLTKSDHHQITTLTFPHQKNLPAEEIDGSVRIIRMPYLFKVSKGYISPVSVLFFLNHARSTDLVILNSPNFEGLWLAIISFLLRKPIITIFHCRVALHSGIYGKVVETFLNISTFIQLLLSQKIVIYTNDYFQSLGFEKLFQSKTIEILPPVKKPLIDKTYAKSLLLKKNNDIWIGFSGRVAKEKGIEVLINAISSLNNQSNYKLVIAGPHGKEVAGESEYYLQILRLLKEKHIKHEFFGCLNKDKLGAFYQAIDILVLPSINQTEAFGMVQVESMLSGTPVIASNLPGVRVPINLSMMGIVINVGSVKELAESIKKIFTNYHHYSNPTLQKKVKKIFNADKSYIAYEQLLHQSLVS
jgi:glycosyltransferase involved in cell wall biosynthesis